MKDDEHGVPAGSVGTARHDAPVTRDELERALRRAALATEGVRDDVIQLAAQVVALVEELTRRLDGVPPGPTVTPGTLEAAVDAATPAVLERIRVRDEGSSARVLIGDAEDKYRTTADGPDCTALLPICQARCCTLHFALSSQDLDEGVIRWDYGKPYLIRQRPDDGYCVHNAPEGRGCTVYHHRPRPCRQYDCRGDARIWADFDRREVAAPSPYARREGSTPTELDLIERVRARQVALAMEGFAIGTREAERARQAAAQARAEAAAHVGASPAARDD